MAAVLDLNTICTKRRKKKKKTTILLSQYLENHELRNRLDTMINRSI